MQENNFEKQVRQKLDGLHLTPSEPVWQKVEATLKKKRDRRLVFWLLPLLFLTIGIAWWQFADVPSKQIAQPAVHEKKAQPQPTFSKAHTTESDSTIAIATQKTKPASSPAKTFIHAIRAEKQPIDIVKKPTLLISRVEHKKSSSTQTARRMVLDNVVAEKTVKKKRPVVETSQTEGSSATRDFADRMQNTASAINGVSKQDSSTTTFNAKPLEATASPTSQTGERRIMTPAIGQKSDSLKNNDTLKSKATPQVKIKQSKKQVQWGIVGRIGFSNAVNPLLGNLGLKSLSQSTSNADYSGVPGSGSSARIAAATPTKGLQFSIGLVRKEKVGKNNFLIAGLQYSYYSYYLTVGAALAPDSLLQTPNLFTIGSGTAFRNNGNYTHYTNQFHYVELPLAFEYRLLKEVPVHVQHGFVVSRLIGSKALQYDYASDSYYQRSAGVRRTAINFFTAVTYTVWKDKALSLQAGPHLQYSLQSIFKNSTNVHWLSGGLSMYMGF